MKQHDPGTEVGGCVESGRCQEVKSVEVRKRERADRMSSRSFAVPHKHELCKTRKCEESPAIQGRCFDHWKAHKERA